MQLGSEVLGYTPKKQQLLKYANELVATTAVGLHVYADGIKQP